MTLSSEAEKRGHIQTVRNRIAQLRTGPAALGTLSALLELFGRAAGQRFGLWSSALQGARPCRCLSACVSGAGACGWLCEGKRSAARTPLQHQLLWDRSMVKRWGCLRYGCQRSAPRLRASVSGKLEEPAAASQ